MHELCKYRSHLSYCAQLSVAQTIENKEMHFTMRAVGEERRLPKKQVRSFFAEDPTTSIYSIPSEYARATNKEIDTLELAQESE